MQGYFQALFACIERLLSSLKVKHFVLPAAEEAVSIWTQRFGFGTITQDKVCHVCRLPFAVVLCHVTHALVDRREVAR